MANVSEVVTLGLGTPSSIPYFLTLGLGNFVAVAPVAAPPQQFPVPWYPIAPQPLVLARPRHLVATVEMAASATVERVGTPDVLMPLLWLRGTPTREVHSPARDLVSVAGMTADAARQTRQVEQLLSRLRAKDAYIDDLEIMLLTYKM